MSIKVPFGFRTCAICCALPHFGGGDERLGVRPSSPGSSIHPARGPPHAAVIRQRQTQRVLHTVTAAAKTAATFAPATPHAFAESFNQELIQAHCETLTILRHLMAEAEAAAIIEEERDPARQSPESRARVNGRKMFYEVKRERQNP